MAQKIALVGHTGFVGSNLCESCQFDWVANSKNVQELYGLNPDILVYAGVTGTKWYANQYPEGDDKIIEAAKLNIKNINPKKLVLISTVDVYNPINEVNEDTEVDIEALHKYGKNRALLEKWVKENYDDYHIVRLPAIYGKNLKKNFVYDLIHIVPKLLTPKMMSLVLEELPQIECFYQKDSDGNYVLDLTTGEEYLKLREQFLTANTNALKFTNSESQYQFYNLKNLWNDLQVIIDNQIDVINLVTEPVSAKEVYYRVYNKEFTNNDVSPIYYNLTSKYAKDLVGQENYFVDKEEVLDDLKAYVLESIDKLKD